MKGVPLKEAPPSCFWRPATTLVTCGIPLVACRRVDCLMSHTDSITSAADQELDLRGVICPYNFVKTKLKLEMMGAGEVLSVLLDDGDPIKNVPRSVSDDGHTVLSQERVDRFFRVRIRKHDKT